jgi:hypothetical protein
MSHTHLRFYTSQFGFDFNFDRSVDEYLGRFRRIKWHMVHLWESSHERFVHFSLLAQGWDVLLREFGIKSG